MLTMDAPSVALVIAAELREHPERWTQGVLARNAQGEAVAPDSPEATCWCLHGLIRRALRIAATPAEIVGAFEQAAVGKRAHPSDDIAFVAWQDAQDRTVADIIAVCDLVAAF